LNEQKVNKVRPPQFNKQKKLNAPQNKSGLNELFFAPGFIPGLNEKKVKKVRPSQFNKEKKLHAPQNKS